MSVSRRMLAASTADSRLATYEAVAAEYYDEALHPTCADFRLACRIYLNRLLQIRSLRGKIADVGSGRSLLAEELLVDRRAEGVELVLLDSSRMMLAYNRDHRLPFQARVVDVEREPFGSAEFDWAFCILGDPYNTAGTWRHVGQALRPGATCILIVPSLIWAMKFRSNQPEELPNAACFVTRLGTPIYLPSFIYDAAGQAALLSQGELQVCGHSTINLREMPSVSSPKIRQYLEPDDPVLDIYEAKRVV
jgi:SAM-dependent methyltransferase